MPHVIFSIEGIPELNARLDNIATAVANPIAKAALQAGGEVVQAAAEDTVRRLTGALAADIVVVTRMRQDGAEKYVLIGPGWTEAYQRGIGPANRGASSRQAANRGSNPGLYGLFLETGHRAPGKGLAHDTAFRRDSAAAKKRHQKVNTHDYGHLSTPAYPWLEPAFNESKDEAMQKMADTIHDGLAALGI